MNGRVGHNWGGVYIFRTRRPGLLGRSPVWLAGGVLLGALGTALVQRTAMAWALVVAVLLMQPRHTAYVGEGRVRSRYRDHTEGSVKYNAMPKPWVDLSPSWYFIPLPYIKPILHSVETLLIFLLWPIYNHQKNLWNPRRIPLKTAKRQRGQRDMSGWSFNFRPVHLIIWVSAIVLIYANGWYPWASN